MENDEFKTILEKFSHTIDELNEFKQVAAQVLGRISEIDELTKKTIKESRSVEKSLNDQAIAQIEAIKDIESFTKKIDSALKQEQTLGETLETLNKNFQGILNTSKQLNDSLLLMQNAIKEQIKSSEKSTAEKITLSTDYILSRLEAIENLQLTSIKILGGDQELAIVRDNDDDSKNVVTTQDIIEYITKQKEIALKDGKNILVIQSGDIHKALKLLNNMPSVCNAMRQSMTENDKIINSSPSGFTSAFKVEYHLSSTTGKTE